MSLYEWPETLEVSVSQEHILQGVPTEPGMCPIALAIREQYPQFAGVEVMPQHMLARQLAQGDYYSDYRDYDPDDAVEDFIRKFDDGRSVDPATFTFRMVPV